MKPTDITIRTIPGDPVDVIKINKEGIKWRGLTKREYFASLALQGLLHDDINTEHAAFARAAVHLADALIEALNNED